MLRRFSKLFPGTPLANLLGAYLQYQSIPLDDNESEAATAMSETIVAQEQDNLDDPVEVILVRIYSRNCQCLVADVAF